MLAELFACLGSHFAPQPSNQAHAAVISPTLLLREYIPENCYEPQDI